MSRKKLNKVLAGMLAATMVLGMSMTAFAGDPAPATNGTGTGTGTFEGHINKDVLSVQLPTADATTFAYTMDPEGLIAATEGAKDKTATFEDGANVYFQSASKKYTKESAKLKVVNKGTVDADVTITAETVANSNVTMVGSSTFTGTGADLYLGLKVANQTEKAVKATGESDKASIAVGLKGRPGNYEVQYDATLNSNAGGYKYVEKANLAETAWNSFEFYLTGACNANGTWSAENLTAPDVTVTWSYAKRESSSTAPELAENATDDAAPSIATKSYSLTANTAVEITVDLGLGDKAATGVTSVKYGEMELYGDAASFDVATKKITIASASVDYLLSDSTNLLPADIVITFNDKSATTETIQLVATD